MKLSEEKINKLKESKFGRLIFTGDSRRKEDGKLEWEFLCDCGNIHFSQLVSVTSGKTKSCGCLRKDSVAKSKTTHGKNKSKVYRAYHNILQRCTNPANEYFHHYGGRGLEFEWINNFEGFYEEIGDPPEDVREWTVERIDNEIGYVTGNIKWAKMEEQCWNKRKYSNNTSGIVGVYLSEDSNGYSAWVASIGGIKNRATKRFSVKKYGYEEALRLACEWRKDTMDKLMSNGNIAKSLSMFVKQSMAEEEAIVTEAATLARV